MRPSSGDRICGEVQIDEDAAPDVGGHVFGPTLQATLTEEGNRKVWLTVIERSLVPSQVDVSSFMARMGALLSEELPGLVPVRLVDREADFCVVGYEAMPGAVPLQRRIEGTGSTAGLVARVAVEVARGLAHLHAKGRVHGALAPGNIVLWQDGVSLWQHGLATACSSEAVAPKFRALGGDVVAPEVRVGGTPAPASDVYTWGAVVAALATDTVGSAALAAVEDGELEAGLLTPIVVAALSPDVGDRPADGLAVLRCIADAPVPETEGPGAARGAELRLLAARYVQEVEGKGAAGKGGSDEPSKRRQFRRTATELYPPGLEPIAGVMIAPDEPEPDPFTVPTDAVAPPEVHQEEPQRVPTPAPMQITARRLEDEPARHFNPDALTPPDGTRLGDLSKEPSGPTEDTPPGPVAPRGVSLPPLVMSPGIEDDFTPEPTRMPLASTPAEEVLVAPPVAPPPSAPIPPPPQHDIMSPEDSGFGLSVPIAQTLDARSGRDDPAQDVVGALAAATSSPHLSTVDGIRAEANPALDEPLELDLDLPTRPEAAKKKPASPKPVPRAGHTPKPIPKPIPQPEPPRVDPDPPAPAIPVEGRLELDVGAASRPSPRPQPSPSDSSPIRPSPDLSSIRAREAPAEARGPRGSTMAALIGFGATILAVGLTVPVAQERGGLSVLLGHRAPEPVDGDTDAATSEDAEPESDVPPPPPTSCPEDMAPLPGNERVCIDRGEYPGLREYPTTEVNLLDAAAACAQKGRRLCTAKEWREACRGAAGRRHQPYEGPRKDGRCNDALQGVPQNLSRGGARETCVSPEGVFDLVGNAAEWVEDGVVMGGDATTQGASCQTRRRPGDDTQDPAIGFRCCVTLAEPEGASPPPTPKPRPHRKKRPKKPIEADETSG